VRIETRAARVEDISAISQLYRDSESEQTQLKSMWSVFNGLDLPFDSALREILEDRRSLVIVGELEGVLLGFAWARSEPMLRRAGGERVGVIRLFYVEPEARGVGLGEAMINLVLESLRSSGHRRFDALVSPGHRLAKNFFEQNGFAARSITMHHEDN